MSQEHLDRLTAIDASFLHQEGPTSHMHVGALTIFEGPPPAFDEFLDTHPRAPAPRPALPPEAARSRRSRPAGRCGSTTRASTSSTTCATPRCRDPGTEEQLLQARRADLLPAARPLQAAVGDVAGRGPRGRALRADLQDPPRADRRHLRRRPRDGAVRPRRRSRAEVAAPRRGVGSPRPSRRSARSCVASGARRRRCAPACARRARRVRRSRRARRRRCAAARDGRRGPRRDRLGGPEPGARRRR